MHMRPLLLDLTTEASITMQMNSHLTYGSAHRCSLSYCCGTFFWMNQMPASFSGRKQPQGKRQARASSERLIITAKAAGPVAYIASIPRLRVG